MTGRVTWPEIRQELLPYTGRDWLSLRIVLSVLLAAVLVMAFQIPSGWLSLYFCFVFAKPTSKQTLLLCAALPIVTLLLLPLALVLLKYTAEPTWLRLGTMAAVIYGAFYLSNIMTEGDVPRNLSLIFLTVLVFPDSYSQPYIWEEATLWLMPMVLAGVLPLAFITVLIPPEKALPAHLRPAPVHYGFVPGWKTNPEHYVYALKGTFAAMGTYFIYTALNFQSIQTALMTCIILGLPTTEQIIHKTWLRIVGAAIGAVISISAAIWLIPHSNALWMLLVVVGIGSALAAWVSLSSPRISYAGRQMALAQFMLITHSFGPSSDLSILRDRLLGILLGNIMMGLTYKYLWPEKATLRSETLQKIVPLVLLGFTLGLFSGCQNTEELAPKSPSQPWRSTDSQQYTLPAKYSYASVQELDPEHAYTLAELTDLAQRNNPKTRIAWEQARAAAASIGVAESSYYPQLNLLAAAGYEYVALPIPTFLDPKGYFYSENIIFRPVAQIDWLLWDFGSREANVRSVREQSIAQNFAFNVQHQEVLFAVCQAYYNLIQIRSEQSVVTAALEDSRLIEKATQSALEQGFATKTELLQAKQLVAQYTFDTAALEGERRKAEVALAQSVGVDPGQPIRIHDISTTPIPDDFESSVEAMIDRALENRPDLRAQVAQLRAAEASVDAIKAQAGPTLVASGNAGPVYSAFAVNNGPWVDGWEGLYGVNVGLQIPIFDGFRRQQLTVAAEAEKRRLEASLESSRDSAVGQVWDAYIDFENARRQMSAAEALVEASQASQDATLASFKEGFSDIVDVQTQQVSLIQARERYNQARTDIFLSAAQLQFATGMLSPETL